MKHVDFGFAIATDHPSLAGHFAGNPVVPGVLLLDEVVQRLEDASGCDMMRIQHVKFTSVLKPGERADAQCAVAGERASFRVSVLRGATSVLIAEGRGLLAPRALP